MVGDHTYMANGTSNVVVTVSDADGTAATAAAPSSIVGGDINAGVEVNLTVASFTSANPYLTASDFQATITWGDGSSSAGYVAGSAGSFTVTGQHAYAVAGTYTAQVQVTGGSGGTLSATNTIAVAPAHASTFEGAIATTVGTSLNNLELALLTLPNGGGAGSYTGMAFWGDGTSSAITLVQNSVAVLEAWGSHAYATAGLFSVKTLIYNAANSLVAAVVSMVEAVGQITKVGPTVVPGNSAYWYEFTVPATAREDISKSWTIEPANAKVLYKRTEMDAVTGLITSFLALVQFPNKALDATLTLANWQKGVASEDTLTVHVVQVFVSDPANGSFKPSQALKGGTQKGWNAAKVTFTAPQLVPNQDVHTMVISSSPGNAPNALSWYADVTLNCPDGNKYLNSIQVGFHQIAKLQAFRTLDATTYVNTSVEDHTYLDSTAPGTSKPWYSADVPGFRGIIGGADMASGVPKTINGADSPAWVAVVEYGAGHFRAKEAQLTSAFQLSVAASTSDNGGWDANNIFSPNIVAPQPNINLPEKVLFPEASAAWSVNANGTISINNSSTLATWTPDNTTAGVKPPQGNVWVVDIAPPKFPDGLITRGQLANDAAAQKNVTYAHYSLQ